MQQHNTLFFLFFKKKNSHPFSFFYTHKAQYTHNFFIPTHMHKTDPRLFLVITLCTTHSRQPYFSLFFFFYLTHTNFSFLSFFLNLFFSLLSHFLYNIEHTRTFFFKYYAPCSTHWRPCFFYFPQTFHSTRFLITSRSLFSFFLLMLPSSVLPLLLVSFPFFFFSKPTKNCLIWWLETGNGWKKFINESIGLIFSNYATK